MGTHLQQLPIEVGGGLNLVDNPETIPPAQATVLTNVRLTGKGRWTTRRAARVIATFTGEVCGIFPYGHTTYTPDAGGAARASAAAVLTWDSAAQTVRLYLVDATGTTASSKYVGTLAGWSTVAAKPKLTGAVLRGVLFLCDEGKSHGLTYYDPNNVLSSGAANGLYQPLFQFAGGTAAPIKCRAVAEWQNLLFVLGYGDESAPDRGESIRFSYLGLVKDDGGTGDAGDGTAPGSKNLFDVEDVRYLSRGIALVGLKKTDGGLVLASERSAYRMYGSDRTSLGVTEIDPERGLVASRAITIADGIVYGLSRLGFWRYPGQMQDLTREVRPRLAEMDLESVFAVHQVEEHQVRWYYTLATERGQDPDRYLAFDYVMGQWLDGTLPFRVACGGVVRPGTGSLGGGGVVVPTGPAGPPTALSFDLQTSTSARASWTNGDTTPGTVTKVYRAPDVAGAPGAYVLLDTLAAGISTFTHSGLSASTTYWMKVEHVKDGITSSAVQGSFATNAVAYVAPPQSPSATVYSPGTMIAWDLGQPGVQTEISVGGSIILTATDATSYYHAVAGTGGGVVGTSYDLRHKDASGNYSSPVNVVSTV